MAARLGGDEFALLLSDVPSPDLAVRVAGRIIAALEPPFALASEDVTVGSSIGIALSSSEQGEADALLRQADAAMYVAKRRGKGQYAVFETGMLLEASAPAAGSVESHQPLRTRYGRGAAQRGAP